MHPRDEPRPHLASRSRRRRRAGSPRPSPNLQNIPIRTEAGRKIRTAFIAPPGHKIISADYSQIELRLLAHIADIPQLQAGLRATASTSTRRPPRRCSACRVDGMTPDLRRQAKTINFGIIYGISAFGLAERLGIAEQGSGRLHQAVFRALPRHPHLYRRDQEELPRERLRDDPVRPRLPLPADQVRQSVRARRRGAAGDQRADPGHRRRHHPPRHGPHGGGARARRGSPPACCCRCTTNSSSRRRTTEVEATLPVIARVMTEAPFPAVTPQGAARRRRAGRAELGRGALAPGGVVPRRTGAEGLSFSYVIL